MSDRAVFCLQCEAGLVVNGMAINNIRFADDTVLLAVTE